MDVLKKVKFEKLLKYLTIFAIACCCVLLFPQVRKAIIEVAEKSLGRELKDHGKWMELQLRYSLLAIYCFAFILIFLSRKKLIHIPILGGLICHRNEIFIFASIVIVAMSVIVRIVMYIKCRSLWLDEAMLAASIVSRNWFGLLVPPLDYTQSAPVLYVIAVKLIGYVFGYSEFSLRLFSLLSFFGLLICETILLKNAFNFDNFKVTFVVAMTALLPSYIWYSNELKPYMGDAFFAILTILIYFMYTQEKIKLPVLTVLFILISGFSSPAIFFTGGILFSEFIIAIFNKNKRQILYIAISGTIVLVLFCVYYYWWMLPVSEPMKNYWGMPHIKDLQHILSPGVGHSDSSIIKYLVPFAFFGIISLIKSKNKIAFAVVLSLFFTLLASSIGKWPLTGRLWLFLPAIILIFTPVGINFIHDKYKTFISFSEYLLYLTMIIYLSVNTLGYIDGKMYFPQQEINSLIYYVQKNIKENEKVYIYPSATIAFQFKNGYNATKIGDVAKENIIYGKDREEWNDENVGNELRSILSNKKTYLIFQHYWVGIDKGLSVLRNYGTLTEIMNVHDTPLYYFELNESKGSEY
jgi:hypothetical protein